MITRSKIIGKLDGLFLAAPRRTGKSTFLRQDLIPVLEARGDLVLYVDLWKDKEIDPAQLIISCLVNAIQELDGPISKITNIIPFSRVGALGFSVELKSSGSWSGTIPDALDVISKAAKKDIVLIIDEAQHSLETKAGSNAMYALKAARDDINQSKSMFSLFLVMTGSHRDKLYSLVNGNKAPFFGSRILEFPTIGAGFSEVIAEDLNSHLVSESQVSVEAIENAFESVGRRPQILKECLEDLILAPEMGDDALRSIVEEKKISLSREIISEVKSFPPLEITLLRRVCTDGFTFFPFSEDTRVTLTEPGTGEPPSVDSIHIAMDNLCKRDFIWKKSYGKYIISDSDIKNVLREMVENESGIEDPDDHTPGF